MAGITSRLPQRLLIALTVVLALAIAVPDAVDSRHKRPKRRNSIAGFATPSPPDPGFVVPASGEFTCAWSDEPVHDYLCAPGPSPAAATFGLLVGSLPAHALEAGDNYPHEPDVDGWGGPFPLASPDIARQFTCRWAGTTQPPQAEPKSWQCSFTYNTYAHQFAVADIVSVSYDNPPVNPTDQWVVPCDGKGPCPEEDPAPDTTISAGPGTAVASRDALLRFSSSEPGSTFACRLDARPRVPCASPAAYSGLSQGRHVFEVVATDDRGKVDATPAQHAWWVDVAGPRISISGRRVRLTRRRVAVIHIRCDASEASGPCAGRLRLATSRRGVRLGSKPLDLSPGRPGTARVRLSRARRALVQRLGRVRVKATARARDSLGNVATTHRRFTLLAPRRRP
jgi:hypothetical protein